MYGAVIGDIVGSKYEFDNIKTKDFPLFSRGCSYTDDTIMTIAVAKALMISCEKQVPFKPELIREMQELGRHYPYPQGGYGGRFSAWLRSSDPKPYYSFGNGSAMRVSPCGIIAVTLKEALGLARASAEVTHDHPEGIKGAQAVAAAIYLARHQKSKESIRQYITDQFGYDLSMSVDEIRRSYRFDESCQGTVPQAIICFLEATDFEDSIRNAISIGGDSDTIGAITGSMAWAYYAPMGYPDNPLEQTEALFVEEVNAILPKEFVDIIEEFLVIALRRNGTYGRSGYCSLIPGITFEKSNYNKETEVPRVEFSFLGSRPTE